MKMVGMMPASFYRFAPITVAVIIVIGNFTPSLPIWGFDYHILNLPYRSNLGLLSNLIILAIGIFPLISFKKGWHHHLYIILAIFALAVLSTKFSFSVYAMFLETVDLREQTKSIFFPLMSQRIIYVALIINLLWSLSLASVSRRELGLIFIVLVMSSIVSGKYVFDLVDRQNINNGKEMKKK
jgi:hypothetical protein